MPNQRTTKISLSVIVMRRIEALVLIVQGTLACRVAFRWLRTARGKRVKRFDAMPAEQMVTILVPILDEEQRLAPCLNSLVAQGPEVREILVVDGGSIDRSREIVRRFAEQYSRVRLIDASPLPNGVNGKAHGLTVGLRHSSPHSRWILTIDADVRAHPALVRSLLAHATHEKVPALSVATLQRLSGRAEAVIHPALLATLVYRFGIPGYATRDPTRIQANGQCFFVRRDVLEHVGGFATAAHSICEDVTLARTIASAGYPVGFYESEGLASVEMYASWREAWTNWTRSLPMRDRFARWSALLGLLEVTAVQALPPWIALLFQLRGEKRSALATLNRVLIAARLGVLVGTARAYAWRPVTFWLSPLCDLPIALRLWWVATRRELSWRGRVIRLGEGSE